jgi:hypothetical protein
MRLLVSLLRIFVDICSADSWPYTLFLTMDANFRLKLHNRHIKNDPALGPGWTYCVDSKPYQEEMENYGDQTEVCVSPLMSVPNCEQLLQISNCQSNLHAIDHANARFAKNCIANGVRNVVCARHTFVSKTSAADLKKGEK